MFYTLYVVWFYPIKVKIKKRQTSLKIKRVNVYGKNIPTFTLFYIKILNNN